MNILLDDEAKKISNDKAHIRTKRCNFLSKSEFHSTMARRQTILRILALMALVNASSGQLTGVQRSLVCIGGALSEDNSEVYGRYKICSNDFATILHSVDSDLSNCLEDEGLLSSESSLRLPAIPRGMQNITR